MLNLIKLWFVDKRNFIIKDVALAGIVSAGINRIVGDLPHVRLEQVIFEAVTNSLQSDSSEIGINFISDSEFDFEDTQKKISQLQVIDNGAGFTDENIASFKEYRSSHKIALGCKGVGRFLYLKVFGNVCIKSLNKEINFTIDKNIEVKDSERFDSTTVYFDFPKVDYIPDYQHLKQNLNDHFLAYFKLLGSKVVTITVLQDSVEQFKIKSSDIPTFKTKAFKIKEHSFRLDYIFNNDTIEHYDAYFCAGNRVVIKDSDLDTNKRLKLPKRIKLLFLLSSEYFDDHVNDTRDNFIIMPVRADSDSIYDDLSWESIHDALYEQVRIIAKENNTDIEEEAIAYLQEARVQAPYLAYYLQNNLNYHDTEKLIADAKKQLEKDKNKIRNSANKANEKLLSIVTQAELAEYIYDRQRIIENIKKLTDEKAVEKEIHNLFMKRYTSDDTQDYRKNNLWLFDDRFMTYDKVFSEAQLKQIFPNLPENAKKPDILSIVSNTFNETEITDIVIIELKRPNEEITPSGAEEQLLRYARAINDNRMGAKIRVWTYAFLKFNAETEEDLDNKSYNKIPTHGGYPIYYNYFDKPNTIINFYDYNALSLDADVRNKTFLKILKGETL